MLKKRLVAATLMATATLAAILFASPPPQPQPSTMPTTSTPNPPPGSVHFDEYFVNKALRLDLYQIGDAKEEMVTLDNIYEEPIWPESPSQIIPSFDACRYDVRVYDFATNKVIYVHSFDGLFGEYRTTTPAVNGVKRVFSRSFHIPEPRKAIRVVIENRDKKLQLKPLFDLKINPTDNHIIRETVDRGDTVFNVSKAGDPHDKVDLAFLSEGYLEADKDKFKADVQKFADALFSYEPYKRNKDKFNIYGVFRPSVESGMDQPDLRPPVYRSTALGASYNTFDTARYLTIQDDMAVHRMAAQVPYDSIVVLVNTSRYGGGGLTMDYCVTSVDNTTSTRIFVHEFGHSFAALADEYVGDVAYNDMFPAGVEPLEPNITRLLDPQNIKWKEFLTPGVALPTPAARGSKEVGAFEGAGYLSKGMYRPQMNCIMGNAGPDNTFCAVCQWGIQRMINYYAPATQPAK